MAAYTDWGSLEKALQDKMREALMGTLDDSFMALSQNVLDFYQGDPVMYERTGAFGESPDWKPIEGSGNSLVATVYMDGDYQYNTGMHPSGLTVFQWAEEHSHGILGNSGTWAKTEDDIVEAINDNFGRAFS